MYILILVVALALAIPTFGASIAFFFLFKRWWDDGAAKLILKMASDSVITGNDQFLYKVNSGAVRRVFKLYGTDELDITPVENGLTLYTGIIRHPAHDNRISLSIFRKSITGELNIQALEVGPSPIDSVLTEIKNEISSRKKTEQDKIDDIPF